MKNIIFTLVIVFSLSSNAYCFDAITFFQSRSVWGSDTVPSGTEMILLKFKGRFNGFKEQLQETSLFGFTTQLSAASSGGVSSSVFVVPGGRYGNHSIDIAVWPSVIFDTLKSVFLIMAFFMFTKILFKGGVS